MIQVKLINTTDEERNVSYKMTSVMCYYTGVPSERVHTESYNETLQPNQGKIITAYVQATIVHNQNFIKHIKKPSTEFYRAYEVH